MSQNRINLNLSEPLRNSGIIHEFYIDSDEQYVKLRLNSKYNPPVSLDVELNIINKYGWEKFANKYRDIRRTYRNVSEEHKDWIYSDINTNGSLIRSQIKQNQQQQYSNNSTVSLEEVTNNNNLNQITEFELLVQTLLQENSNISLEQWSAKLLEKRTLLNEKINEYFPTMQLLLDFELAVKKILNIQDITLPFMGIVFAVPSSLKTAFFKFLRNLKYSYYTDKFTARSFVSHSANVPKEKLVEIDMLPQIKGNILLTPELSALFTSKDDDIREQFGIITRVLDGEGLETNSGVHGKRGYYGKYMFTWLGAAVDIPYSVYKFLSTIGFKIYFLRLSRNEVSEDDLYDQLTSKKKFGEKMEEVESLLIDYLAWFEICPISIGQNNMAKIEWDSDNDDKEILRIIARLALLLAHLRGHVIVYESSEHPDYLPINNSNSHSSGFSHRLPIIENPSRAAQQLYNLARGHALSYGRNYITIDDIQLVIKVVLSTSLIERVLILDLLIANNGTLTTKQIIESLRISPNTAKRTMTEFKGLELVDMDKVADSSNSEYKITLNPKFNWFLTKEFKQLREEFKPTDYQNELKKRKSAVRKNTPVQVEKKLEQETDYEVENQQKNNDVHRGEIPDSKNGEEESTKGFQMSPKGRIYEVSEERFDELTNGEGEYSN